MDLKNIAVSSLVTAAGVAIAASSAQAGVTQTSNSSVWGKTTSVSTEGRVQKTGKTETVENCYIDPCDRRICAHINQYNVYYPLQGAFSVNKKSGNNLYSIGYSVESGINASYTGKSGNLTYGATLGTKQSSLNASYAISKNVAVYGVSYGDIGAELKTSANTALRAGYNKQHDGVYVGFKADLGVKHDEPDVYAKPKPVKQPAKLIKRETTIKQETLIKQSTTIKTVDIYEKPVVRPRSRG